MKKKIFTLPVSTVLIYTLFSGIVFWVPASTITGSDPPMPPEENRLKPDHAPTPFSAADIRQGCPPGYWIKFKIETPGKSPRYQVTTFKNGTDEGTDFETVNLDEKGDKIGDRQTARATWQDLQAHASFPQAHTRIQPELYTTPMGTFEGWLYIVISVEKDKKKVQQFRFARSIPGPPVNFEQWSDGRLTFRMTMIDRGIK